MYVCMYVCMCMHTCMHVYMYHTHSLYLTHIALNSPVIYVCMYVCICIYHHTQTLSLKHTHIALKFTARSPRRARQGETTSARTMHALTFVSRRHHPAAGDPSPPLLPGGRISPGPDSRLRGRCQNTQPQRDQGGQQGAEVATAGGQSNSEKGSRGRRPPSWGGRRPAARRAGSLGAHTACRLAFAG